MGYPRKGKRRYGLPWTGYQSSVPPHLASADKATSDGPSSGRRSQNFRFGAAEGLFYCREGTARVGTANGVLEDGTGEIGSNGKCCRMASLRSPSLTSGYPTYMSLWRDEGTAAALQACLHFYSTNDNGGSPYGDTTLGDEFSTTTNYPTTAAGGVPYSRVWPYIRTADNTTGRLHTLALRTQLAAGSRNLGEFNDKVYFPSAGGTPSKWFKEFNDTNAGTNVLRVLHTGRPGPLGLPRIAPGTVGTDGSWHEKDVFYISVAYQHSDGSVSMPILPRSRNDEINYDGAGSGYMSGFGRVQIDASGTDHLRYMTWSNIPIGPADVTGRYLLRSPKWDGTGTGSTVEPSPTDLRITAFIPNNTQTTYQDPNGNDLALVDDPLVVRFDHIMQPPARYMGSCDGRIVVGYTNPHPVAIYIAPDVNVQDGDSTIDDVVYAYSLTGGTLTLKKDAGSTTITNIGSKSIQQLIDLINNTVTGGGGGKWFAVHAPGADLAATCDDIGTAADNDNLVDITGATNFTGDGNGIVRAWASSWPAPIFWSSVYLGQFKTQKRRIFFTMGGPGMPSMAADSWAAGNFRTAPESYGDFMGTAPLPNGAVMCFSKGVMVLQNRKSGISGEDVDYRLYDLNPARGCVSPFSICAFNGAVGYMTADGYVVTDGQGEVLISGDVWNSGTQTGEWAYEIAQSQIVTGPDTDGDPCHATVLNGKLYINYRLNSNFTTPAHRIEYDFTGSSQFSGLRGVLQGDGTPWGWSTPISNPVSMTAMTEVQGSTVKRYASMPGRVLTMTATGRIYQIETGTDDDGTTITPTLWTARDMAESLSKKSAQEVQPLYYNNGANLTLTQYRDAAGSTGDTAITLATTAGSPYLSPLLPMPQDNRTSARQHEYKLTGLGSQAPKCWGMELTTLVLDSY